MNLDDMLDKNESADKWPTSPDQFEPPKLKNPNKEPKVRTSDKPTKAELELWDPREMPMKFDWIPQTREKKARARVAAGSVSVVVPGKSWECSQMEEFGDRYDVYRIRLEDGRFKCTCQGHAYGDTRMLCTHAIAAILVEYKADPVVIVSGSSGAPVFVGETHLTVHSDERDRLRSFEENQAKQLPMQITEELVSMVEQANISGNTLVLDPWEVCYPAEYLIDWYPAKYSPEDIDMIELSPEDQKQLVDEWVHKKNAADRMLAIEQMPDPSRWDLPAHFSSLRPHQWDALRQIIMAWASGKKYVFLDAPTGAGKSILGCISFLEWAGIGVGKEEAKGMIAVTSKDLQDQMDKDFNSSWWFAMIKGRMNYPTANFEERFLAGKEWSPGVNWDSHLDCSDCEFSTKKHCRYCDPPGVTGPVESGASPCLGRCPYQVQLRKLLKRPLGMTNMAYLLRVANSMAWGQFEDRTVLVVDECLKFDTIIDTSTGTTRICDCSPGTLVYGWNGTSFGLYPVTKLLPRGNRMTYRVRLSNGRDLIGTSNHPVLSKKGWIKIGEIKPGESLRVRKQEGAQSNYMCHLLQLSTKINGSEVRGLWNRFKAKSSGPLSGVLPEVHAWGGVSIEASSRNGSEATRQSNLPSIKAGAGSGGDFTGTRTELCPPVSLREIYNRSLHRQPEAGDRSDWEFLCDRRSNMGYSSSESSVSKEHWDSNTDSAYSQASQKDLEGQYIGGDFVTVVSISENGYEEVYDLEVSEVHNFVADGVVVHNCDTLESVLMGYVTVEVSEKKLAVLGQAVGRPTLKTMGENGREDWFAWAGRAKARVSEILSRRALQLKGEIPIGDAVGEDKIKVTSDQRDLRRDIKQWETLSENLTVLIDSLTKGDPWIYDGYQVDRDTKAETGPVVFKPVRVNMFGPAKLFDKFKNVCMMSATLISSDQIARDLGVSEGDYATVSVPRTFDPSRCPVNVMAVADNSFKEQENSWPVLSAAISKIVFDNPDHRIMIHAVSYVQAEKVFRYLKAGFPTRSILTHQKDSGSKKKTLEVYEKTPGAVLISPSMARGADFKGDLCRVQILIKVPFPNLGDKQISARLHSTYDGQTWYSVQTIRELVQMTGRGMRSESDWCVSWILDKQFLNIWGKNQDLFPEWWRRSVHFIRGF